MMINPTAEVNPDTTAVRRVGHVAAQPQRTHEHLDQPGQRHDGERFCKILVGIVDEDHRHGHRQRRGRPGDLGL